MAAYVIVDIEITDPKRYDEYRRIAAPTVTAHGGRYVVRGGAVEKLEGAWKPSRLVVLEFPSAASAREWWSSEDYRPARELRESCTNADMIVVEGV